MLMWRGSGRKKFSVFGLMRADLRANKRNHRAILVCVLYRLAHGVVSLPPFIKPFGYIYIAIYKIITEYVLGTEVHWRATIGGGLHISHGYGVVIHGNATIGERCLLRHGVTIGVAHTGDPTDVPQIGDDVEFGAHAIVIGRVTVGNGALIGAGAVVVSSVPDGAIVVGNPSSIKGYRDASGSDVAKFRGG